MQVVHVALCSGEGKEAVDLLETLGIDIEDYKLIESETGDFLIINLLYGNMDALLDSLTSKFSFEHDEPRSLIIFTPDTVIPRDEDRQDFRATRETIITFARNNSGITPEYIILVVASAVITSLGLILDNIAVVVGGMVIAPVLGPILAITIGIVLGKTELIRKGISAEVIGIIFAIFTGFLVGWFIPDVEITGALRIRMYPTIADFFIATAAGAAAAYLLLWGQVETGLVGVMVAASLLPVMCTIGVGISFPSRTMIMGALLLLAGNLLGLLLANIIVFYVNGLSPENWYRFRASKIIRKSLVYIIISVIIMSLPLGVLTVYQFSREKPAEIIKSTIRKNLVAAWEYRIEKVEIEGRLINIYIYAERDVNKNIVYNIKHQLENRLEGEYNINLRVIKVEEIKV